MKLLMLREYTLPAGMDFPAEAFSCPCGCTRRWYKMPGQDVVFGLCLATQKYGPCGALAEVVETDKVVRRLIEEKMVENATEEAQSAPIN